MAIEDERVSEIHCAFYVQKATGRIVVEDADSLNGTWLAGCRLVPGIPYLLRSGDELCLRSPTKDHHVIVMGRLQVVGSWESLGG